MKDDPSAVIDRLHSYFRELEQAFAAATSPAGGAAIESLRLANRTVRLAFAGKTLQPVLLPSLAHSRAASDEVPADLEVLCWDTAGSGVTLPPPPWQWPRDGDPVRIVLPSSVQTFRLFVTAERDALALFDVQRRRAVFWSLDAGRLRTYWYGSPLLNVFHWWGATQDLHLLHAGCIGTDGAGVLFAGRGGSGKSTTALLGLAAGMRYVGDDYVLFQDSNPPLAHCLYSSAKLRREHLRRFPQFAACAIDPLPDEFEKPVVLLHDHFGDRIAQALPLRAVVLPSVATTPDTSWQRISPGETLRALAPTTLLQMPDSYARSLPAMARLVRRLPCFRLDLGSRLESIAPAVGRLIEELK